MKFSKYIAFSSYRCIHMCISCMHIHTQTCTQVNASYLLWDFGWRSIASSSSMSNQQVLSFNCLMSDETSDKCSAASYCLFLYLMNTQPNLLVYFNILRVLLVYFYVSTGSFCLFLHLMNTLLVLLVTCNNRTITHIQYQTEYYTFLKIINVEVKSLQYVMSIYNIYVIKVQY